MTAIPQQASARAISDRLTSPLREVARRQWVVLAAVGVFKTLIAGLIALLAAALLLGYFQNLWMPVRVTLAIIAWALVIGSAVRFLRPALGRWSLSRAAMQIEQDRPGLQERLSSAIELANETDPTFRGSPGLIAHLFRQAEADATAVQPAKVVPTDRIVRWALLFAPVLLAWMTIALIPSTTKTAMAGLYRVLMPWKNALPALLTQVVVKPGDITLVQGDPLDVTAHVSFDSGSDRNIRHATLIRKFDTGQRLTDDMEQASPRDYRLRVEDVQQTFAYMVSTDQGDSQWYKAIVHPRPQISSVEVRCDYPAYTGMSSTVVSSREGAIEALVGTRVTVTVHTQQPVVAEKSQIVIDTGTPDQLILPLKQLEPTRPDYQAQLIVSHNGEYRINLSNEFDLTNKDEQPRSIVAQPDEVPTIVIRSPEPRVSVGADDIVPVKYIANDDFAVAKIEALVQVDDGPVQTVPVTFKTADKRTVTGPPFIISVADVVKSGDAEKARQITYQLKVTDNRDPDPQFSFSSKQTLKISRGEYQTYQTKEERKIAENLTRAIQKAVAQLNDAQQHVTPARDIDAKQRLEEWNKKQLHEATQELPTTSRELTRVADEAKDTVFQDIAKKVQRIATKTIRIAAEDATQADLNSDNGEDRRQAANRAILEITQAREDLQKLLDTQAIDKTLRQAEAARDLADAAKKQEQAAEMMKSPEQIAQQQQQQANAQTPKQRQEQQKEQQRQQQQAMRNQEQANQKLQQALQQSEALRDPKAQETARQLGDLIRKVEELEKRQDMTAEQTEKQQAAAEVQQKANELAQKQEALNQEIQKSAEKNQDALQKASANPPSKDQQQNIVRELNRNNIQPAHDQMRQAANQLHQAAQQLNNQARSTDLRPTPQQQDALNKDQQAADQAQNQKNAAQQAANDLKQEAAQPNAAPKPDDQAVANAKQAAKEIERQADELHPQADDAKHSAAAAKEDAQSAEKAADEAASAADPKEAQKNLNDAAKNLEKAGQELADASKKNSDADKGEMVKAQQKDAAAAAEQAEQQAKKQEELAQGLDAQEKALAEVQNRQPPEASAQQQREVADQARAAQQQAEQLERQAEQANNPDVQTRAEQAKADLNEAGLRAEEAGKAEQQAAQSQQEAANADNADKAKTAEQTAGRALEQAANDQRQAQDALAKAESELRNLPTQEAMADAQKNADAKAQAESSQQPKSAQEQAQAAASQQAAQAAQEAAQAQQEASQQNPTAARQAAKALAQAAQALAQATPGLQPGQPQNEPGNEPGQEPSPTPGQSPDSKQGITAASAPINLPASVRDIGITADQWAILPPLVRMDLMNAAQQNGPPSYRQMIKDYYVRVAKIQQAGVGAGQ